MPANHAHARPLSLLGLLAAGLLAVSPVQADSIITVGTDDHTGAYYRGGGAICALINEGRAEHRMRCRVTSTAGSTENIDALRAGRWALGFASGDIATDAASGSGVFANRSAFSGLRVVTALNHETVTIVARGDAGIDSVRDLSGQRVNIGAPGSTQRAIMGGLIDVLGWSEEDFEDSRSLTQGEQVSAFCDGELDAVLFVTSHPSRGVGDVLACGGVLVPIEGAAVNRMVGNRDPYSSAAIPAGTYSGENADIPTYSVVTLLLSSTNTSRETVYEVTRALYAGLDRFREWHPAFADLDRTGMIERTRDAGIPLHPGAEMYFEDEGLL